MLSFLSMPFIRPLILIFPIAELPDQDVQLPLLAFRQFPQKFPVGLDDEMHRFGTHGSSPLREVNMNGAAIRGICTAFNEMSRFHAIDQSGQGCAVQLAPLT